MAELVDASGLSVGAIYRYFTSKDEIIAAICGQSSQALSAELTPATIGDFLDHIRGLAKKQDHARLVAQIYAEAAVSPPLAELVQCQLADLRRAVAALLPQDDQARADQIAEVFIALCRGYTQQLAVRGDLDPAPYTRALEAIINA